nr:PilZ domain-containing protein [Kofleriaceae bacterium]
MPVVLPTLVDAYLLLEQPRQRLSHWSHALAALDSPNAPPLASVTAYYDPTTDQALLGLRYDELALGADKLAFVVEIALLAEIGMVQPGELSDGERKRFVTERLARCSIHIAGKRTAALALAALVRKLKDSLKESKLSPKMLLGGRSPMKIVEINSSRRLPDSVVHVRATTETEIVDDDALPPPPIAKGTRSDLGDSADEAFAVIETLTDEEVSRVGDGPEPPAPPRADLQRAERTAPPITAPPPIVARHTIPRVSAGSQPRFAEASTTMPKQPPAEPPIPEVHPHYETEPYLPTVTRASSPDMIYARYLRSGRWVPIRIGQLSLKGAALLAGALPRVQDHVDVALSFANQRALVRGTVAKVSTVDEAATSGQSTFSVAFELDDASRRQLTALLTAARAAHVTIKPPPPRSTRRFPVDWPVQLGTMRGAVRAEALDVSLGGLFVRPQQPLVVDTALNFSAVLEDGGAPIAGRARVVRQLTEGEAKTCGLSAGFGLRLVDMGDADHERWRLFLARIEKRADRRILIGASPIRLAELQSGLAAAGYAVTGGTDPGALVQLATADSRPVDAAVVDAGWLGQGASATWVESLFSARNVPCVTHHGDGRRARSAVDKLLQIA